jgi:hypothetical protein
VEVLAFHAGDDFEVLDELVGLALVVELGLLLVPGLREVVQLTQRRGAVVVELVGEEVDGVDGLQELPGAAHGVRRARARAVAVHPDVGVLVVLDVGLRARGQGHPGDLPVLELVVELFGHRDEAFSGVVVGVCVAHWLRVSRASSIPSTFRSKVASASSTS